jgi:hypothetical protein
MKITKRWVVLCTILLIVVSVLPAFAADVTGTWTAEVKGAPPNGQDMVLTFVFKQDGTNLTGTTTNPLESADITKGKVDGDKISFVVTSSISNFAYEGTIAGDEIKVTVKPDNPDFPSAEFTLKRSN